MSMSMIPLLLHSDAVSANARQALADVIKAPPGERAARRMEAARVLFRETDLDCAEVKDLMGLPRDEACAPCT